MAPGFSVGCNTLFPEGLTELYCPACRAFVAYLEVSRKGRVRPAKERKYFRRLAYTGALICSETCKIAAMQQ